MNFNYTFTSLEVIDLISALRIAIADQESLMPDYEAKVMIESFERLIADIEKPTLDPALRG